MSRPERTVEHNTQVKILIVAWGMGSSFISSFYSMHAHYVCRDSTIFSKSQIPNLLDVYGVISDLFYAESNTTSPIFSLTRYSVGKWETIFIVFPSFSLT